MSVNVSASAALPLRLPLMSAAATHTQAFGYNCLQKEGIAYAIPFASISVQLDLLCCFGLSLLGND